MPIKVAILNDCTDRGHFGPRIIMDNLLEEMDSREIEVLKVVKAAESWKPYRNILDTVDLVIVNGEGSIHHGRRMELLEVAEYYPSVLINAVYQDVPENDWIEKFKYISVRESLSQMEIKQKSDVVPDLMFMHDIPRPNIVSDLCVVDSVATGRGLRPMKPGFIEEMGGATRVCAGRFHAICLAMLWGMPFSAYPSNTHKIEGMLTDADCFGHFRKTQAEALEAIAPFDARSYISHARKAIGDMFNQVVEYA